MDPNQTAAVTNLWLIIGAYIVPSIIAIGGLVWKVLSDRKAFQKTEAETKKTEVEADKLIGEMEHLENLDSAEQSRISLAWATEFSRRLKDVEDCNTRLNAELTIERTKRLEVEEKVRVLELAKQGLEIRLNTMQIENNSLITRIKDLETENETLKRSIRKLTNGG